MDIWAVDGKSWAIGMMARFKYKSNKDRTLSIWSDEKAPYPVNITTNRGIFVEAVDEAGEVIASGGDGDWCYVPLGKKPVTLRYRKLSPLELTPAQLKKARRSVTRNVLDGTPYSDEVKLPDTLTGLVKWAERLLARIPAASRAKASFRFDTSYSYGESYPHVEVSYSEPETDAEVIERLQIEAERARIAEAEEREKLRQLQAKFPATEVGKSVESAGG